jgi:hypothetical protein
MTKAVPAPASLVREVEALIVRGERLGHVPSSRPEIYVGDDSWTRGARGEQPASIRIDHRLLERPAADRHWVIGHELGHLLPVTAQPWSVLQRTVVGVGVTVVATSIGAMVASAISAGEVSIVGVFGIFCGLVIVVSGQLWHNRDIEAACDRASAVIYGQTMSEEHAADLLRREGLVTRLSPTALRTHPRPRRRWEQVRSFATE